jgi:hypothetical protein
LGHPIRSGFIGLSLEFPAIQAYGEHDPALFAQLVRNLAPDQSPVLKVGGDSTDWAWWPVRGLKRPPGIRYPLGPRWLRATRTVADALHARMILGLDLEANSSTVARAEMRAFLEGIGRRRIEAFELGNEPELYPTWGWYRAANGREVPGRPPSYDFGAYIRNYAMVAARLPQVPLAGPAIGEPSWMRHVGDFIAGERRLSLVTLHRYPLQRCFMPAASPLYPTIPHLLAAPASAGLADSVRAYVRLAHARGLPLRVDELNSVSCAGAPGVSDVFASALWILGTTFQMARIGVDGVNIHTFPAAAYRLFGFFRSGTGWRATVQPEYYGLIMFAQAAPPGSRLLRTSGVAAAHIQAWATRATDGTMRVVLINQSARARVVAVRPWSKQLTPASAPRPAELERLIAPSIRSRGGITLGGQTFGAATGTGLLAGHKEVDSLAPWRGAYAVALRAHSAVLLTIPPSP